MFVAIIVGLCSVAISKFVIDHNWTIKLPDVCPKALHTPSTPSSP